MELLTIAEVARLLRVSRSFAYLLAARGEIPSLKIGRAVRVPADRLEAWMAERITPGASKIMSGGKAPA